MARKKVVLHTSAKREWEGHTVAADTSDGNFSTVIPTVIEPATRRDPEITARGMKLWLEVTARVDGGNASPAALNMHLEEQDPLGNWLDVLDTTMTPIVTSSAILWVVWDPRLHTQTASAAVDPVEGKLIDKPLSGSLRLAVDCTGSTTATPSFTFASGVELFD